MNQMYELTYGDCKWVPNLKFVLKQYLCLFQISTASNKKYGPGVLVHSESQILRELVYVVTAFNGAALVKVTAGGSIFTLWIRHIPKK